MKLSSLTYQLKQSVRSFIPILRHHFFVVSIIILGFLIYSVWAVDQILSQPSDEAYRNEKQAAASKATFDQPTIEKIQVLKKSSEPFSPSLPANGRINPFAE